MGYNFQMNTFGLPGQAVSTVLRKHIGKCIILQGQRNRKQFRVKKTNIIFKISRIIVLKKQDQGGEKPLPPTQNIHICVTNLLYSSRVLGHLYNQVQNDSLDKDGEHYPLCFSSHAQFATLDARIYSQFKGMIQPSVHGHCLITIWSTTFRLKDCDSACLRACIPHYLFLQVNLIQLNNKTS